jgi:hypothetical protein
MTVCYPQIITAGICPRSELTFSLTPPTCVRVVPVYNDASYVISQFPPPVHFLVRDNGQVYQLADIQSPPSTPPEYHAILDSTGCILIGVELSAVTTVPLTNAQISVLPGVIRYVLQTLGLPLTSVINTLPPQRCRPQLWQQILAETTNCLNTQPPPPPPPPGLTCSFVLSCISSGQNVNISTGGVISAGQLVPGPDAGQYTWLSPNGTTLFTFDTSAESDPCLSSPPNLVNFPTNGLLATYNANTGCLERIAIPSERVVYGEPSGNGSPRADNLRYSPSDNFLRATVGPDFPMRHSFMLYGTNSSVNNFLGISSSVIGAITETELWTTYFSFVNISNAREIRAINSVVVGQTLSPSAFSSESALLFRESSIGTSLNSFIAANRAAMPYTGFSFVSSGFNANHRSSIYGSLCITISGEHPPVDYSTYIARETFGPSAIGVIFSNALLDSVSLSGGVRVSFSSLHLSNVTLNRDNLFSFIAANNATLEDIRFSLFISESNLNQSPSTIHSFVSMRQQGGNRIGPATPTIVNSVMLVYDNFPSVSNTLLISEDSNRWLNAQNSVYVARDSTVFADSLNNTATLSNSLIVGQNHNVFDVPNVDSLTLIGRNLRAGTDTVFGVGFNAYAPPAVINAGGWRAFIADGGADNANYFQGWASAWRFRLFNPATNYPNETAATAALNAAYGTDPRNDIGTMVVVRVAGRPAIFSWNGATFTRITT